MLREKKPCSVCAADQTAQLRDCPGCKVTLCRYCAPDHVCGEDGRSELVQLLEKHVTDCEGVAGLTLAEIGEIDGAIIVAYLPSRRAISKRGLRVVVEQELQRAKHIEAATKNIAEALCKAPLSARGAICVSSSDGLYSLYATKKADTPEVMAQFRTLLDVRRLSNF
jgi:hypothetical protein